jgi:PleD family two-component response regulator
MRRREGSSIRGLWKRARGPGEGDVDGLMERTDRALYRAKAAGRGPVVIDGS